MSAAPPRLTARVRPVAASAALSATQNAPLTNGSLTSLAAGLSSQPQPGPQPMSITPRYDAVTAVSVPSSVFVTGRRNVPETTPVADLAPAVEALGARIGTFYVFGDDARAPEGG